MSGDFLKPSGLGSRGWHDGGFLGRGGDGTRAGRGDGADSGVCGG